MPTNGDPGQGVRGAATVDDNTVIEDNKEAVAHFVDLTNNGKRILKVDKAKADGRQLVLLNRLGKPFSKVAEYSSDRSATNTETIEELDMPSRTVGGCLLGVCIKGFMRDVPGWQQQDRPGFGTVCIELLQGEWAECLSA